MYGGKIVLCLGLDVFEEGVDDCRSTQFHL